MALHDMSFRTTLVTATAYAALAAIRGATARPTFVREIHLFGLTAPTTSGSIGLCHSSALGTGTLTSVTPVARKILGQASTVIGITNWTTASPTNGGAGAVFRRWTQSANIGNGMIWTFDGEPLELPLAAAATGDLSIVNLLATAPGTFEVNVVLED